MSRGESVAARKSDRIDLSAARATIEEHLERAKPVRKTGRYLRRVRSVGFIQIDDIFAEIDAGLKAG